MNKFIKLTLLFPLIYFNIYGQDSSSLSNEEKWNCKITFENDLGPFNVFLFFNNEVSGNFTAHSSKNSDKRIFGGNKATIARLLKKSPKKGVFIKITNGKVVSQSGIDSLYGTIHLPMIGAKDFKAVKVNDSIYGGIVDSIETIGKITGVKSQFGFGFNYKKLSQKIYDTAKTYIYDPLLMKTRHWKRFTKKVDKLSVNAIDDIEFFLGFNILSQKLRFSHFNLFMLSKDPGLSKVSGSDNLSFEEINKKTGYLDINSFGGSSREMDSVFKIILNNNYDNLLVDLRDNAGGGITSAIPFGKHLIPHEINAGYFVTNKWHKLYYKNEDSLDFSNIPITNATITSAFIEELKHTSGKQLIISPDEETFKGDIYILTNGKTASTCEPIVYELKKNNLAVIVGETTAGAMLSAALFNVYDKYYVSLPIADYYTSDGQRLDQIGVEPNVIVKSENALDFVIDNLIK